MDVPVAGVGAGAQDLLGLVQGAIVGQQIGQPLGGEPVADVGPGAQPVQVPPLGQQVEQLQIADLARLRAGITRVADPAHIRQLCAGSRTRGSSLREVAGIVRPVLVSPARA